MASENNRMKRVSLSLVGAKVSGAQNKQTRKGKVNTEADEYKEIDNSDTQRKQTTR